MRIHHRGRRAAAVATLLTAAAVPALARASDWPQLWGPAVTAPWTSPARTARFACASCGGGRSAAASPGSRCRGRARLHRRVRRDHRPRDRLRRPHRPHALAGRARRDATAATTARATGRSRRPPWPPAASSWPARAACSWRSTPRAGASCGARTCSGEPQVKVPFYGFGVLADRRLGRASCSRSAGPRRAAPGLRRGERQARLVRAAPETRATRPVTRWRCRRARRARASSW